MMKAFKLLIMTMVVAMVVVISVLNRVECHNANENSSKCDPDDVECHERAKYTKGKFFLFKCFSRLNDQKG
jgi:hypothetical protein